MSNIITNVKATALLTALVVGSALSHILPVLCFAVIGMSSQPLTEVIAAVLLLVSSVAMGYLHGLNRTHETFKSNR